MGWLSGKAVYEERDIEDKKRWVQIKPLVDGDMWAIFKGVAQMSNIPLKHALTEAIKLWVDQFSVVSYECKYCGEIIEKDNYVATFTKGKIGYYCSIKCCDMSDKN